jgi:hypothetical protein
MKYFPTDYHHTAITLEARASIALQIICTNSSLIAGVEDGEDSTGRARIRRCKAEEVAAYAFALADAFMDTCESRGDVRPFTDPLARANRVTEAKFEE